MSVRIHPGPPPEPEPKPGDDPLPDVPQPHKGQGHHPPEEPVQPICC